MQRFVDCLDEIRLFPNNKNIIKKDSKVIVVELFVKLYFTDLCSHLKKLIIKLQGVNKTIIVMFALIKAFDARLPAFNCGIVSNSCKYFSNTKMFFLH